MEQAELSQLSGVIRSAMGDSAGQFREAAERGNANLAKIMGTIAAAIKAQRQDLSELQNVLSENESVSERNSSTLQAIQSELQDINSGIHDIATGMKNMARGISNVDNSIFRLNQDLQSSIGQSLLPGLLTGLSGTASSIVKGIAALAMGGLAIGGAKTAMDYMTGGGAGGAGGGLGGGGATHVSNPVMAKDIYNYLTKEKGVDHDHAVGMLANIQNESKFNSAAKNPNDRNGPSGGLFQHHDNYNTGEHRFTDMTRAAGPDWQKNWKGQIDFALTEREMKTYLSTPVANAQDAASQFVYKFEKPQDKVGEAAKRAGNVGAIEKVIAGGGTAAATKTSSSGGASPQSSPMQSQPEQPPVASENVPRVERIGGEHGHGPISGASHDHNEKEAGVGKMAPLPGGDIVALGRALQSQGILVSEHPAFGGVHPEKHYPGSAHNDGLALDINAPGGITEAQDPVWGKRFDELAKQIQAAGYTVLWRTRGHDNHIHAQIGGKGIKGGQSVIGGQTTPGAQPTPTTPGSSAPSTTPGAVAMTSAMPGVAAGITPEQMAMMTSGMNPAAMAATSAMMTQLQSAQEEAASIAPQQQTEQPQAQQDNVNTQLLEQLSRSSENTQILQQAAVSKQAQQEISQQEPLTDIIASLFGQQGGSSSTVVNNNSSVGGGGYNGIYDVGWPDWAEMIGGNHWKEMKNYKKNMWG